jgi:hypothetical protein
MTDSISHEKLTFKVAQVSSMNTSIFNIFMMLDYYFDYILFS